MPLELTKSDLALGDFPTEPNAGVPSPTTFYFPHGADKFDVLVLAGTGDVRVELYRDGWQVGQPYHVRAGMGRSFSGFTASYPPDGIHGLRLFNWTKGQNAVCDLEVYSAPDDGQT
jgi:hypothetical protein